jgi:hypothetical protein
VLRIETPLRSRVSTPIRAPPSTRVRTLVSLPTAWLRVEPVTLVALESLLRVSVARASLPDWLRSVVLDPELASDEVFVLSGV